MHSIQERKASSSIQFAYLSSLVGFDCCWPLAFGEMNEEYSFCFAEAYWIDHRWLPYPMIFILMFWVWAL